MPWFTCEYVVAVVAVATILYWCPVSSNNMVHYDHVWSNMETPVFDLMTRWKRAMNSDIESCSQSPIQMNMTLKGGIEAGYFRKLAQHVAMQLCVELCCEEKGCDVAVMNGKNCFGVQCFNEELCRSIPVKKHTDNPFQISHVTFKAEKEEISSKSKLQCSATRMRSGVTLHGGLKAGNFTDVGKAENMQMCVRLCCVADKCDVAMMVNENCFLVSCFSKKLCESRKSLTMSYKPKLAYVLKKAMNSKNNTVGSPKHLQLDENPLICKNSQIFYNSTLKGGYKAGNYTKFGKVANMSACIRRCCGNKDCDAAMMLENNCFAVACTDAENCLPVHAKDSGSLASLNPRLSFITSRSEEVAARDHFTSDGSCHAGIISYDVSLRGGMSAGKFTPHGKVANMETCIGLCCQSKNCSLAMMLKDACFTVVCKNDQLCEKKQAMTSSKFNPRVAYVFRSKKTISDDALKAKLKAVKHHQPSKSGHSVPLSVQLSMLSDGMNSVNISTRNDTSLHLKNETSNDSKNSSKIHHSTKQPIFIARESKHIDATKKDEMSNSAVLQKLMAKHEETEQSTLSAENSNISYTPNVENATTTHSNISDSKTSPVILTNLTIPSTVRLKSNDSDVDNMNFFIQQPSSSSAPSPQQHTLSHTLNISQTISPHVEPPALNRSVSNTSNVHPDHLSPGISLKSAAPGCTHSDIMYNVTLRSGLASGKFTDRGEVDNMNQCTGICCLLTNCDLSFMLHKRCFSVQCVSEKACEAQPATSTLLAPAVCYVYSRQT